MANYYKGNLQQDYNLSKNEGNGALGWLFGNFSRFKDSDDRKIPAMELKYWKASDSNNSSHPAKFQKECWGFTMVLKGEISGFIEKNGEKEETKLSQNDFVIIPPQTINNLVLKTSVDAEILTIKTPSDPSDNIKIKE